MYAFAYLDREEKNWFHSFAETLGELVVGLKCEETRNILDSLHLSEAAWAEVDLDRSVLGSAARLRRMYCCALVLDPAIPLEGKWVDSGCHAFC